MNHRETEIKTNKKLQLGKAHLKVVQNGTKKGLYPVLIDVMMDIKLDVWE